MSVNLLKSTEQLRSYTFYDRKKPVKEESMEKEKIIEILKRVRSNVDYESGKKLIDDGILDSFDIVGIVNELVAEFDVEITIDEMIPENFNSVEAIAEMIERLE